MDNIPDTHQLSALHFYSYGIVAAPKPIDSNTIEVYALEVLPMVDGEITDAVDTADYTGVDAAGASFSAQLKTSVSISANWVRIGESNRLTSPDVRRGERVIILRFADSSHYFWVTSAQDSRLRRLETVVYGWSASGRVSALSKDDYYFLEVSTHSGLVTFHTSDQNGEYCRYDIQLNTKAGSFTLADSIGNEILLDSKVRLIHLKNQDGSVIDLNRQDISVSCSGTFSVSANKITMSSKAETSISAGSSAALKAGSTLTATGSSSATLIGGNVNVTGASAVAISSPSTSIS